MSEQPIVDGFTLSADMLYLPTTFRASAISQMDVLRRAKSYRLRQYCVPDDLEEPIPAYGQIEYQVVSQPGAYLWGIGFSVLTTGNTGTVSVAQAPNFIHVQITDACTETPLLSDYAFGNVYTASPSGPSFRNPCLISPPRLLGNPARLNVELYNRASVTITCQLLLHIAEPQLTAQQVKSMLASQGVA